MGMGFASTWLRQVSPPPASHDHFNHWIYAYRIVTWIQSCTWIKIQESKCDSVRMFVCVRHRHQPRCGHVMAGWKDLHAQNIILAVTRLTV